MKGISCSTVDVVQLLFTKHGPFLQKEGQEFFFEYKLLSKEPLHGRA
jgi:hypothetical protein